MQAIRVHPAPEGSTPYSPTNPAPSSSLHLDEIPIPQPSNPGELLIRIHASTVIRDSLTWPETYNHPFAIPGHDFAGTVTATAAGSSFQPGDEVFGMANAERGATWAEYSIVLEKEVARKSSKLDWAESASLPLSAQTAYEALFEHAGVPFPKPGVRAEKIGKRALITGATGGVGMYMVQLAAGAGLDVTAATTSKAKNEEFLKSLGAGEIVENGDIGECEKFDIIIDILGGEMLKKCWGYVVDGGVLISIESAAFDFVEEHKKLGIAKEGVKALFFIVEGKSETLQGLTDLADAGLLHSFVARTFPLAQAKDAYDYAHTRFPGRGKIVITI